MSTTKHKKFDKMAVIGFAVNFCAVFALILVTGLLLLADSLGGARAGLASVSQSLQNGQCNTTAITPACSPIVPVVLFPVSSGDPVEVPAEIMVDDAGFLPKELNMALSSSRTVKVFNRGVKPHSFVVAALGVDSGAIAPGEFKTMVLENLLQDVPSFDFYSNIGNDTLEKFSGTIIVK